MSNYSKKLLKHMFFKFSLRVLLLTATLFVLFWWSFTEEYDRYLLSEYCEAKTKIMLQDVAANQYVRTIHGADIRINSVDFLEHALIVKAVAKCSAAAKRAVLYALGGGMFCCVMLSGSYLFNRGRYKLIVRSYYEKKQQCNN